MAGAGHKPNSVPAEACGSGYLSVLLIAQEVKRPTCPVGRAIPNWGHLVLLQMGFTTLLMSPSER